MSEAEWAVVLRLIGSSGVAGLVGALVASIFIRSYAGKFLAERAKVAATKADIEDLKAITRELKGVEQAVEHRYNEALERMRLDHQLRFAALDRRLQAHQDAYAICRHLVRTAQGVPTEASQKTLAGFQEWWSANSLYLSSDASNAVYEAYLIAPNFRHIEQTKSGDEAAAAWEKIIGAESIVSGAAGAILGAGTQRPKRDLEA